MNNMHIKYRPHRGSLKESMEEEKVFSSTKDMIDHIVNDTFMGVKLYEPDDISIGDNIGKDDRIDWKETRYVLTKRCGKISYDIPQAIGMCSFEDD